MNKLITDAQFYDLSGGALHGEGLLYQTICLENSNWKIHKYFRKQVYKVKFEPQSSTKYMVNKLQI